MDPKKLRKMDNEEVIAYPHWNKGSRPLDRGDAAHVRPWPEDVFAVDDTGIQNAMIKFITNWIKAIRSNCGKKCWKFLRNGVLTVLMPVCICGGGRIMGNAILRYVPHKFIHIPWCISLAGLLRMTRAPVVTLSVSKGETGRLRITNKNSLP